MNGRGNDMTPAKRCIGMFHFPGSDGRTRIRKDHFFPLVGAKEGRENFHATELPLGIDGGRPITLILDLGDSYDGKRKGEKEIGDPEMRKSGQISINP